MKGREFFVLIAGLALCVGGMAQAETVGQTPGTDVLAGPGVVAVDAPPDAPAWGTASRYAYVVPGYTFNNLRDSRQAR